LAEDANTDPASECRRRALSRAGEKATARVLYEQLVVEATLASAFPAVLRESRLSRGVRISEPKMRSAKGSPWATSDP
jgi:hypothetical protein